VSLPVVRQLVAVLPRVTRWPPVLAGWLLAAGALVWKADDVASPAGAATLLRVVAVVLATGVVALVDDAAANVLASAPVALAWRSGVRFAAAAAAVAVPWSVALLWVRPGHLAAGLTLECAALTAVALAVAGGVARWSDTREPSVAAGPAVLGAVAFGALLPSRWAMFATPGSGWVAAHARWAVVLGVAVAVLLVTVRDPAAGRVRQRAG
jgi:fluoroquinolone transport system permease protein